MSPEAATFLEGVRKIDGTLADLIKVELDRGVSLVAMQEMLRGLLAVQRDLRAAAARGAKQ